MQGVDMKIQVPTSTQCGDRNDETGSTTLKGVQWVEHLNNHVLHHHGTRLVGGFPEPFYQAAETGALAEVQFTRDYERSALHELAHWCIAGKQRRLLNDYGYWYVPDGRSGEQQRLFYEVETRPQALEKHFCTALGISFEVSADNLGNYSQPDIDEFSNRVNDQYRIYQENGFPSRAIEIFICLRQWHVAVAGQGNEALITDKTRLLRLPVALQDLLAERAS
jgi:elongation factor P hydroxylase